MACIDTEDSLKWNENTVERRGRPQSHIIEVLAETVPDSYLAYLRGLEISYIFAGKDTLDVPLTGGMMDTTFIFDRSDFLAENNTVAFSLEAVRKLPGNSVWLNYKPNSSINEE